MKTRNSENWARNIINTVSGYVDSAAFLWFTYPWIRATSCLISSEVCSSSSTRLDGRRHRWTSTTCHRRVPNTDEHHVNKSMYVAAVHSWSLLRKHMFKSVLESFRKSNRDILHDNVVNYCEHRESLRASGGCIKNI